MRRRDLIAGALGLTTGAALLPTDAAAGVTSTIEDVIFGRITAVPLPDHQPRLLAQATAGRHHPPADQLVLRAAQQLDTDTGLTDPRQTAMYGQLLAVAAYTAAMRDDRDTAWSLLGEAEGAARRAGTADLSRLNPVNLAVYKISIARTLGDYGTAVDYARQVDPARISAPERRARYWQDTGVAFGPHGEPGRPSRWPLASTCNGLSCG